MSHVGDYVAYAGEDEVCALLWFKNWSWIVYPNQILYGLLLACFKEAQSQVSYTLLQKFETISSGIQTFNEMECPLLELTDRYEVTYSTEILGSVSIIHDCGRSCRMEESRRMTVEREELLVRGTLCMNHDINCKLFALNIYSMSYHSVQHLFSLHYCNWFVRSCVTKLRLLQKLVQ